MNSNLFLSALAMLLLASVIKALPYDAKSDVVTLDSSNFEELVFGSEHVWMVEFYAPWCGHCKTLAPEYEKMAKNLKGIVKVGAINCDEEKNKQLAGQYGIKGFPTLKLFPSQLTKQGNRVVKVPEDYNGERKAGAMSKFMTDKLPSFVEKVSAKNEEKFLEDEKLAKVILFTDKTATATLYKALSIDYHHQLKFGEVLKKKKKN